MVISEITIKNFKSFGNNEQKLKINTEKGELILLSGNNGNGKSSLISSFDYSLYGKVKGNKKKWAVLGTLPNRINSGSMLVNIKFKANGNDVEVKRGISPNILELWENNVFDKKAGKGNLDDKIERYVDMDIETFKSFISMSINDFKNFIQLTTSEKKLLLDKLFNLEVINILAEILKEINKDNKTRMSNLDSEINALEGSILSIEKSIKKHIEKEKENISQEIEEIMESMRSKKDQYKKLKEKVDLIKEKDSQIDSEIEIERKQLFTVQNDIKNVNKEINLYDSGKCPTCSTDFNNEHFSNLRGSLVDKKNKYTELMQEVENNLSELRSKKTKLNSISEKTNKSFNDLNYLLKTQKSKIEELNIKNNKNNESINLKEFEESILELKEKKSSSKDKISVCKEKELYYKELNNVLSEDGVKKSIISGIIKPINKFISENIKKMRLPFEVKLDKTFNAEIKSLGSPIEHDSLSTGETKKINIAILIAYLKLIRTKKHINILFLDEVFSSIDMEGIDSILTLLKSFANEYKINIFVVHHAILSQEMFDRIIKINKDVFSSIEELSNDELV